MVSIVSWILASICNSIMDTSAHHFSTSIFKNSNPMWWNAEISWKNKYIDFDFNKGFRKLSTNGLFSKINYPVQLTDSWHLFKMLMIIFLATSVITFQSFSNNYIIDMLIYGVIWNTTFSLFYNKILRK